MSNSFWASRREATLNWLALGLLLAAWNAADKDVVDDRAPDGRSANSHAPVGAPRRPAALRGYDYVSVRAAHRIPTVDR
jgi:hypothetical protein